MQSCVPSGNGGLEQSMLLRALARVAMGPPGPEVEQYMEHRWLGGEG